eukprot:TRINITY_DN5559_c0_g1_i3.p2 TRINITY_DN5559_c0_g1~~TRINITY_DN5559_c0_g1_i3.p2  ORF type:complete len:116 (-),score=27.87 TRINITY_DN5559_c0_g1_i3:12-359(-)
MNLLKKLLLIKSQGDGLRKNINNSQKVNLFIYLVALKVYGHNWKKIELYVPTRTGIQIRSHAQKHFKRLATKSNNSKQSSIESPKDSRNEQSLNCLLYTSPSPRDQRGSRMPSSA